MIDAWAYLFLAEDTAARSDRRVRDDVRGDCVAYLYSLADRFSGDAEDFDRTARAGCARIRMRQHRELFKPRAGRLNPGDDSRVKVIFPMPPPPRRTEGQKRRTERDLVIAAALKQGVNRRVIARALGVSKAKVAAVAALFVETEPCPSSG